MDYRAPRPNDPVVKLYRALLIVSFVVLLAFACHKTPEARGPFERAGTGLDRATDKTGQALSGAASTTGTAVQKAGQATGKAFEKVGAKLSGKPGSSREAGSHPPSDAAH